MVFCKFKSDSKTQAVRPVREAQLSTLRPGAGVSGKVAGKVLIVGHRG